MKRDKIENPIGISLDAFEHEFLMQKETDVNVKHPSPEQLLIRQATKYLTAKQRVVWELHNFDKLTQDEIASKLKISQQAVAKHIKACEVRIVKWVKNNFLKSEYGANGDV